MKALDLVPGQPQLRKKYIWAAPVKKEIHLQAPSLLPATGTACWWWHLKYVL